MRRFKEIESELKPYSYVISKLPLFKKRKDQISIILKEIDGNDYITGLLLEDNFIYPLKMEKYDKQKHKLKTENMDYVIDLERDYRGC